MATVIDFNSIHFAAHNEASEIKSIINVLASDYKNGFRFDSTALRLLSDKLDITIDETIQNHLKELMFCRADNLYFLPVSIADKETLQSIHETVNMWVSQHACFEVIQLYNAYIGSINKMCVDSIETFTNLLGFLCPHLRIMNYYNSKIVRVRSTRLDVLLERLGENILIYVKDHHNGSASQHDIEAKFPAFSASLLALLLKHYVRTLFKTIINDIAYYQTWDVLGLSDDLPDILDDYLLKFEELALSPTEEALHTAISLHLRQNIKAEYNLDSTAFKHIITTSYRSAPRRDWQSGQFKEVIE